MINNKKVNKLITILILRSSNNDQFKRILMKYNVETEKYIINNIYYFKVNTSNKNTLVQSSN
jgi:hypothetical protein